MFPWIDFFLHSFLMFPSNPFHGCSPNRLLILLVMSCKETTSSSAAISSWNNFIFLCFVFNSFLLKNLFLFYFLCETSHLRFYVFGKPCFLSAVQEEQLLSVKGRKGKTFLEHFLAWRLMDTSLLVFSFFLSVTHFPFLRSFFLCLFLSFPSFQCEKPR